MDGVGLTAPNPASIRDQSSHSTDLDPPRLWLGGEAGPSGAFCGSSGEGMNCSLRGWLGRGWASEGLRVPPGEDTGWACAEK